MNLTPLLTGRQLIDDVDAAAPAAGECAFWWLGQQGFIVKLAARVLYLDPYLSPRADRRVPPLLAGSDVTNADIILGTHDHIDHIDRPALPAMAAASPQARIVIPELRRAGLAHDLAIDPARFVGMDDGATVELGGVRISAVASAHELLDRDAASGRYPYLGYVIEGGGVTIYHAGDCCMYEGLITKLRRWRFDLAFLPINGRDARRLRRGCIGNMTYQEAADLAGAIEPRLTVPAHYEMFEHNSQDPQPFVEYMQVKYPRLATCLPRHGQRIMLPPLQP